MYAFAYVRLFLYAFYADKVTVTVTVNVTVIDKDILNNGK